MTSRYSPTVRKRRLSALLRQLRHSSGKTLEQAAEALEWSRGRLHHMEGNNWSRPDIGNIRQLLDLYEVHEQDRREEILALARQAKERGWWTKYDFKDVTYVGLESEANVISTYQSQVIPGLLQTAAYAEALARTSFASSDETQRIVDARMARQEILSQDNPPTLWAVIDEAALRRVPRQVAHEQLKRLIDLAEDDTSGITIQVMPFSAELHPAISGSFTILDFRNEMDIPVVYLETHTDGLYLDREADVTEYKNVLHRVQADAHSQAESIDLMKSLLT